MIEQTEDIDERKGGMGGVASQRNKRDRRFKAKRTEIQTEE